MPQAYKRCKPQSDPEIDNVLHILLKILQSNMIVGIDINTSYQDARHVTLFDVKN